MPPLITLLMININKHHLWPSLDRETLFCQNTHDSLALEHRHLWGWSLQWERKRKKNPQKTAVLSKQQGLVTNTTRAAQTWPWWWQGIGLAPGRGEQRLQPARHPSVPPPSQREGTGLWCRDPPCTGSIVTPAHAKQQVSWAWPVQELHASTGAWEMLTGLPGKAKLYRLSISQHLSSLKVYIPLLASLQHNTESKALLWSPSLADLLLADTAWTN